MQALGGHSLNADGSSSAAAPALDAVVGGQSMYAAVEDLAKEKVLNNY